MAVMLLELPKRISIQNIGMKTVEAIFVCDDNCL